MLSADREFQEIRTGLFEVGRRYLVAWATLLVVAIVATYYKGPLLNGAERTVEETGGIVVFLDLIALTIPRAIRARTFMRAVQARRSAEPALNLRMIAAARIARAVITRASTANLPTPDR